MNERQDTVRMEGEQVPKVDDFKYVGSTLKVMESAEEK